MLKHQEASDPNSCWNKARDNQVVFVLIDSDDAMAHAIREWAKKRIELGLNQPGDAKIVKALVLADQLEAETLTGE